MTGGSTQQRAGVLPTVLLTNDDGWNSPGIGWLYEALSRRYEVAVVAPEHEQSGIGHAFTYKAPLYCRTISGRFGERAWSVSGSPSDCVKMAVAELLDGRPDIVVSGMNVGENSGICGYYSGTVAAAREAAFWRIPGFAFSVEESGSAWGRAYADAAADIVRDVLGAMRGNGGVDPTVFYNVNFPGRAPAACRGTRVTRQSMAYFDDRFRKTGGADGRTGYVIYGEKAQLETDDAFDARALLNGYTCITPLHFDATAEEAARHLKGRMNTGAHEK